VRKILDCFAAHCTICQRQSGSAFGMGVGFQNGKIEVEGTQPAHLFARVMAKAPVVTFAPNAAPAFTTNGSTTKAIFPT